MKRGALLPTLHGSLFLDTSGTLREHGGSRILASVGDPVEPFARVQGVDAPAGMLSIVWDRSLGDLVEGAAQTPLPVESYDIKLNWVLLGLCPGSYEVSIEAIAGSLVQISVIPITINTKGQDL